MSLTTVHLLRHGEVHNPEKVLYGRLPGYRLSERGEWQAKTVATALADQDVTVLLASPLQRAQQTAGPIAESHRLEILTEPNLIEAANVFEGKRIAVGDGALRHPAAWPKLINPFRPSWGEPYTEIATRMRAAITRARELAAGHTAVCVSHQLPIWTVRRSLEGKKMWHDPRQRQCGLASLTTLLFEQDRLVGVRYQEPAGSSDPTVTGA
ncbi:histidine phosphatase family protein [Pseudonocardia spinosispora]|uniref:histidine phosphatase family protein n=1 Tax=Pseudonocardia spinosispora TaxID=103441 RepID=UPI00042072FA|nr:histidine phosphatase family protein [Pseudonocardia spinosispora]